MNDRKIPLLFDSESRFPYVVPQVTIHGLQPLPWRQDRQSEQMVRDAIEISASRNTELLVELATTADAPSQLPPVESKLTHLKERLTELESALDTITTAANLQLESHKSYRDSVARKLIYSLLRKQDSFKDRAEREQKAYYDTIGERHKIETRFFELKTLEESLETEFENIKKQVDRHTAAHEKIDRLYASVFKDRSPGYRDEDEQEARYLNAQATHAKATEDVKAAVRGVKATQAMRKFIDRAFMSLERAALELQSTLPSLRLIRESVSRSAQYTASALELSNQVNTQIPSVLGSGLIQAKGYTDQFLESARVTSEQHAKTVVQAGLAIDKIGDALKQALVSQESFSKEMKKVCDSMRVAIRGTARSLENERQALYQIRQRAFEVTVGFGAAAPAYHECCDRADSFYNDSDRQCALVQLDKIYDVNSEVENDYEVASHVNQPPSYSVETSS